MSKVVGIGAALLDLLAQVDSFPIEDTKKQAISVRFQGGGPCATALVALQKLDVETQYIGAVGDDMPGAYIIDEFNRYGVDTSLVSIVPAESSSTAVVLSAIASSTRTVVWAAGSAPAPQWSPAIEAALDAADILHLDGNHLSFAIEAAQYMHSKNKLVSHDAGGLYPNIEDLLPHIDILIPSEEFACGLSGHSDIVKAALYLQERYCPKVLVITQGKKGGVYYDRDHGVVDSYPAFAVEVVDTNGAGDVFHGAFLAATLKGLAIEDACVFASAVSALKCTVFGAREGIPSISDTLRFLEERGVSVFFKQGGK